jgi:hypothetical protein
MACGHRSNCPLFPLLNASLRGWRDEYCDSETMWRTCARYQRSGRGESVPLALLPNGHLPIATARAVGAGSSGGQAPEWAGVPLPVPVPSPGLPSPGEQAGSRRGGWLVRVTRWLRSPL